MSLLIQYTLIYGSLLTLVALGGCYSERSGIINIGLEGIMVIGALGGVLMLSFLPPTLPGFLILILSIVSAVILGILFSLLLGVASINFKADQTLAGTALNMLGLAFATVLVKAINIAKTGGTDNSAALSFVQNADVIKIKAGTNWSWFMVIAVVLLIVAYVVLYKTRFGLRLMSCGEHPQAAASVGINVQKMRYAGVMISGALGGLGGFIYVASVAQSAYFDAGVKGFGFLALAVMIFGQWKPHRIALAALLFGSLRALGIVYSSFDFLNQLKLSPAFYNMLPYIICLVVLAFTSKKSRAPKAEGIPYDKGTR